MNKEEREVLNSVCSQLEHYVDCDGKQKPKDELKKLLDRAEILLTAAFRAALAEES